MANYQYIRPEVEKLMRTYAMIEDCLTGERAVKSKRSVYLPIPNAADSSSENKIRYDEYLARAVFYNVARRTSKGLVGLVFKKDPIIKVPKEMEKLLIDVTGSNLSLIQFAKHCVFETLAYGRCGIHVDYPATDGLVTMQDITTGRVRPFFKFYSSKNIINWRKNDNGANQKYKLIVLKEKYVISDDGFELHEDWQYKALINDYITKIDIYRPKAGKSSPVGSFNLKGADGNFIEELPFVFIGSDDNDALPDNPPIYDLVSLNIAHYRNSADYEESSYICGQPTPYFYGLSQDWVDNVLKGRVCLGSRAAVPLPINGGAGLIQAEANSLPFEAMQHKEKQMIALGAKLIEQRSVQRTATEANIESSSDNSIISTIAGNVSDGIERALKYAAVYMGIDGSDISFKLEGEFNTDALTIEEANFVVRSWVEGAITFTEMRTKLKTNGYAFEEDSVAMRTIKQKGDE